MSQDEYKKILDGLGKIHKEVPGKYYEDFVNPTNAIIYTDGVLEGLAIAIRFIRKIVPHLNSESL